jgi:hypothetical protein
LRREHKDNKAKRQNNHDYGEQDRKAHGDAFAAARQQDGRSDRAGPGHQWNGERKGGDIAHVLFDGLLGLLRLALGAHAEHHV